MVLAANIEKAKREVPEMNSDEMPWAEAVAMVMKRLGLSRADAEKFLERHGFTKDGMFSLGTIARVVNRLRPTPNSPLSDEEEDKDDYQLEM